jgi:hypothetical protein
MILLLDLHFRTFIYVVLMMGEHVVSKRVPFNLSAVPYCLINTVRWLLDVQEV